MGETKVNLSETNHERLRTLQRRTGRSADELVNDALARLSGDSDRETTSVGSDEPGEDWKVAWRRAQGMWKDRDDLPEFFDNLRNEWDQRIP